MGPRSVPAPPYPPFGQSLIGRTCILPCRLLDRECHCEPEGRVALQVSNPPAQKNNLLTFIQEAQLWIIHLQAMEACSVSYPKLD